MTAQELRTKRPERDEVGDSDPCWVLNAWLVSHKNEKSVAWKLTTGKDARWYWYAGSKWLPYTAIYDPTNPNYPNNP